jgi:tRNA A37 threonylcarbamoyltransferase TsaD
MLVRKCAAELSADPSALGALSWAIQDAIVDTLVHKTRREAAARKLPLVVCGGVSANQELRRRLSADIPRVVLPPFHHCVDNGAMIAYVAGRYLNEGVSAPGLDIFSRWPVEHLRIFYGVSNEAR